MSQRHEATPPAGGTHSAERRKPFVSPAVQDLGGLELVTLGTIIITP